MTRIDPMFANSRKFVSMESKDKHITAHTNFPITFDLWQKKSNVSKLF